jgi:hypothetical protein
MNIMKNITFFLLVMSLFFLVNCNNADSTSEETTDSTAVSTGSADAATGAGGGYVDLKTGKTVTADASGKYVDESGAPVRFYVNMDTRDTFDAETGTNVNNSMIYDNGDWRVNTEVNSSTNTDTDNTGATDSKTKSDNLKVKSEEDKYKVKAK